MPEQRLAFDSVHVSDLTVGQYRNLLNLAQLAVSHPTTDALFPTLALRLRHFLNFDVVTLGLYDSRTESIRLDTWNAGDAQKRCESIPVHTCTSGWVWKKQRSVLIQDLDTEPKLPVFLGSLRQLGVRTYYVFPLTTSRHKLGAIGFGSLYVIPKTNATLELLRRVAAMIAQFLDATRSSDGLIAQTDCVQATSVVTPGREQALQDLDLGDQAGQGETFPEIVGNSAALREVLRQVRKVAATDATVLLLGETGTGNTGVFSHSLRGETVFMARRAWPKQQIGEWQQWSELAHKAGLSVGLWDWDVVANTVAWSDEAYRLLGFTRDTFSGRVEDAVARIHPEDRARLEDAIYKVLAGGTEYAAQYRVVWPDKTICWIEAHSVLLSDGPAIHMLGIGIDITNLKKSEQSGQESEEKYLLLLNSTAAGIYGLDLEENCTFCNPACLRLLGYQAPEALLGKNMHALIHHTRADGTPYPEEECQIHAGIREHRAIHLSDEVLWRVDGTYFQAEYLSYPMHKAGTFVGSVVTFIDISERKRAEQAGRESEEKYRKLFENATYGIFRSNREGDLLEANPALVAMLGYSSKAELMTHNLNSDIYQNPLELTWTIEKCESSGRVDGVEVSWRRADGKIIAVRMSGKAIRRADGQTSSFEGIVEDITERRSLEEQLRQAQKMEAVGLLAGGISHDFNNHLNVILGNADLLLEKTQSAELQHHAEEIKKATQRAAQLTRQLLAFSRKQVLQPTLLDLNAVVSDVVKILRHLIGEDLQIVIGGKTNLASIRADRGQVEQILMNLANNARDAMPNGGKFTLRTENAELGPDDVARYPYVRPGRYVHLSVSDTGVGMSEAVRTRVFEPFFTTKPLGKGTGLGLATVYVIVKQSGGYIWISSAPGKGATFDIYLPRVDEVAPPLAGGLEVQSEYPRGIETILVLEDEESLRAVTCECLTAGGYSALQAGRGDHAIEVAQQYKGPIHLILSDVVLPDISGPSAVKTVQALHPETKALFVSGYAEVPVAQTLIAQGAILLQKPVSRNDLMREVDKILHLRISSAKGVQSQ